MTNLVLVIASVLLQTNRIENLHPSGKSKTVTEIVYQVTTWTNSITVQTNITDFVETEVAVPYPSSFAISNRLTLKVWRKAPKPVLHVPRDPLNMKD